MKLRVFLYVQGIVFLSSTDVNAIINTDVFDPLHQSLPEGIRKPRCIGLEAFPELLTSNKYKQPIDNYHTLPRRPVPEHGGELSNFQNRKSYNISPRRGPSERVGLSNYQHQDSRQYQRPRQNQRSTQNQWPRQNQRHTQNQQFRPNEQQRENQWSTQNQRFRPNQQPRENQRSTQNQRSRPNQHSRQNQRQVPYTRQTFPRQPIISNAEFQNIDYNQAQLRKQKPQVRSYNKPPKSNRQWSSGNWHEGPRSNLPLPPWSNFALQKAVPLNPRYNNQPAHRSSQNIAPRYKNGRESVYKKRYTS